MKLKLLLVDNIHREALEIIKDEVEVVQLWASCPDIVYTGLTSVNTCIPVFCPCTNVDHVKSPKIFYLDDEWKKGEGKKVTSTAEHTWSLILQLAKLKQISLSGKTIGIIGLGRIGSKISDYARVFDMHIIVHDKYRTNIWVNDDFEGYDENSEISTVLSESDIITLHVPLNEETRGMINKEEFAKMKPGALLINTSRAEIVHRQSLINVLFSEKIGGYADDFQDEVLSEWHNVIQTPHIAGNSLEARRATDIYIAKKILKFIKGGQEPNERF